MKPCVRTVVQSDVKRCEQRYVAKFMQICTDEEQFHIQEKNRKSFRIIASCSNHDNAVQRLCGMEPSENCEMDVRAKTSRMCTLRGEVLMLVGWLELRDRMVELSVDESAVKTKPIVEFLAKKIQEPRGAEREKM